MEQQVEVDELDVAGSLAAFGELRALRDRAERDILVLAAHLADLYNVDADAHGRVRSLPGGQRALPLGGDGTPLVWEFAVAELAVELHVTVVTARRLVGDGLDIRHRLPRLWRRVYDGEVPAWRARKVAAATRDLTRAQALVVDDHVAVYADGRLPFSRFMAKVEAEVVAADPDAAAERERARAAERFAKVGQSNDHGQKTLYVKTSAAEMTRIEASIAYLAEALRALGDGDPEDLRRTKAVLILANPVQAVELLQAYAAARRRAVDGTEPPVDQPAPAEPPVDSAAGQAKPAQQSADTQAPPSPPPHPAPFDPDKVSTCSCGGVSGAWPGLDTRQLLPSVTLYLHVHEETLRAGNGVVRWEGEGPITWAYVRDVLGPQARFVVKPVIDLGDLAAVDAYEVPERLREGVHLRTPADVFPFAASTSRGQQMDHTKRYVPPEEGGGPGQTAAENLGGMRTFHHRVKTHGGWKVEQPFPGIYLWMSPHGSVFLVDNTGTRQIRGPRQPSGRRTDGTGIVPAPAPPGESGVADYFWALLERAG